MQNFQRHQAIVAKILREVNSGHPTAAELAVDCVSGTECVGDLFCRRKDGRGHLETLIFVTGEAQLQ
jgi:hypothetical protein